mmetsp:Transcript_117514/g.279008  ORF Transcript_117514/g.279008 Transcript_117514/m.279008 type:complete len:305 (+) Transcript_117514:1721-2635(+)
MVCGAEQVCLHFRLRIVEARRAPSRDLPQASFVLVLRHTTVLRQAPLVIGEVGPYEVHEHRDAVVVQGVHEETKVVRRAKATVHGIEARSALVTPRLVTRILRNWQELHRGKAHLRDVRHQRLRDVSVVLGMHPAAQVDLIDGQGLRAPIPTELGEACGQPVLIGPREAALPGRAAVIVALRDHGIVASRGLHKLQGIGIYLDDLLQCLGHDVVGILLASQVPAGQEDLPDAVLPPRAHGMRPAVPVVEVPHHAHRMRTGRPDRKASAPQACLVSVQFHMMCSEHGRRRGLRHAMCPAREEVLR